MGDTRRFTRYGNRYELTGLGGRADDVRGAASTVATKIERRVWAAQKALEEWTGPHAATFATHVSSLVRRMGDFESVLKERASYLASFPAEAVSGSAWVDTPRLQAASVAGTVRANPLRLRNLVNLSASEARGLRALPERVNTDGVTGTSESERPLTVAEQQAYLHAGWSVAEIAAQRVTVTRQLSPGEITELVHVSPVDGHVEPIVAAADQLDTFVSAVADAIDRADGRTLALLAMVDPSLPSGASLQAVVADFEQELMAPTSYQELVATMDQLTGLAKFYPELPSTLIASMGSEGVNEVFLNVNDLVYDVPVDQLISEVVTPWSRMVAASTAPGGLTSEQVHELIIGLTQENKAALIATASFDERFLGPVFDELFYAWNTTPRDAIGGSLYSGDVTVAALLGLKLNEAYAAERFAADPELLDGVATGWFNDEGAAAGALLSNIYYEQVLEDLANDPTMTASLDASAVALAELLPNGGFNGGARVALAEIASLHFDDFASIVERDDGRGRFNGVDRQTLIDFYDELFESQAAADTTGTHMGVYAAGQFTDGLASARQTGDLEDVAAWSAQAGAIIGLGTDALKQDEAGEARWANFLVAVGEAGANALVGGGLLAAGASGGVSLAVGAPAGLAIGEVAKLVPRPTFDEHARSADARLSLQVAAASALIAHPEFVPEGALSEAHGQKLRESGFLEKVASGNAAAAEEFSDIIDAESSELFKSRIERILGPAILATVDP